VSYADRLALFVTEDVTEPQRNNVSILSGINRAPHEMSDDVGALDIITHVDYMDLNLVSVLAILHI
jgi:hypothetical protein